MIIILHKQTVCILIHSADPHLRPVVIIVFAHVVRSYVRTKQNKCQAKTMFTTGEPVGLVEWINDDACLVISRLGINLTCKHARWILQKSSYWFQLVRSFFFLFLIFSHLFMSYDLQIKLYLAISSLKSAVSEVRTLKNQLNAAFTRRTIKKVNRRVITKNFIDPLGRPTVPAGSDHYFRTGFRPSVRPHFSKYRKTKQTSHENNDRYWWDCGSVRGDH